MTDRARGREAWTRTEIVVLAAAVAVGVFWRLYGLSGQLLLDDEWHALNFVLGKPFFSLFVSQGVGANSIPVNVYDAVLLKTVGWSETLLRFRSLAAGIVSLVVLPVLVRRLCGRRVASTFAFLLAISPVAVFYSRNTRPYSIVMLFGSAAMLAALLWRAERRRGWVWAYVVCGFVAVAHHLLAAIPVFTPLLVFGAEGLGYVGRRDDAPPLRETFFAGALLGVLSAVLLAPANLSNPWWLHVGHADHVTLRTLLDAVMLVAGSSSFWARGLFALAAARGLAALARKDRAAALTFGVAGALYLGEAVLSHQEGSHAAIQIVRYGIALLPAVFVLVGFAVEALFKADAFLVAAALLLGGLFAVGPLPEVYGSGTNFAHHSAFQYDYSPMDWSRSRERELYRGVVMEQADVNPCYSDLVHAPAARGVIEYPVLVGDHLDVLYYTQHFHGKPVVGGYRTGLSFPPLPSHDQFVYGDTPLDYIFSRVPPDRLPRLRFANLIDVGDAAALKARYPGWAVVVHRNPVREAFPRRYPDWADYGPSAGTAAGLQAAFGTPVCRNEAVQVFRIP